MPVSKNRRFASIANDVTADGTLTAAAISPDVELGGGGITVYDSAGELPLANLTSGDQAFVSSTNRLYLSNGTGWYNVSLINNSPTIASVNFGAGFLPDGIEDYYFDSVDAGTATVSATDSEGVPLTYSYTLSNNFNNYITLSQDNNVFTFSLDDSNADSSATIAFTASDGINIATSNTFSFRLSNTQGLDLTGVPYYWLPGSSYSASTEFGGAYTLGGSYTSAPISVGNGQTVTAAQIDTAQQDYVEFDFSSAPTNYQLCFWLKVSSATSGAAIGIIFWTPDNYKGAFLTNNNDWGYAMDFGAYFYKPSIRTMWLAGGMFCIENATNAADTGIGTIYYAFNGDGYNNEQISNGTSNEGYSPPGLTQKGAIFGAGNVSALTTIENGFWARSPIIHDLLGVALLDLSSTTQATAVENFRQAVLAG